MKHIIGPFYYQPPCFIGIQVNSRKKAVIYNIVGAMLTVGVIVALVVCLR